MGTPRLLDTTNNLLRKILEALTDPVIPVNPADAFVTDFVSRSAISDQTQIDAVQALVEAAMEHGWWDKCDLIYPFVGGTALAHAQNLKSVNYTFAWTGAVTHDANGITGDASTGYGNTGYMPSTGPLWSLNSAHMGFYRRNLDTLNRYYAGINTTGPSLRSTTPNTSVVGGINSANISLTFAGTSLRYLALSRFDATNCHVFSSAADINVVAASTAVSTASLTVLGLNAGAIGGLTSANLAGFTAGAGLTFAEYEVMAADWQDFQTALGREITGNAAVDSFLARAAITDPVQRAAVNQLYLNAVAHGWWDECDLIYPFVGGTAGAHAQNLKTSLYSITWAGGVTHDANGITGDGTTGYGNTGYNPTTGPAYTLNSAHASGYRRTFGTFSGSPRFYLGVDTSGLSHNLLDDQVGGGLNDASGNFIVDEVPFIVITRVDGADIHVMTGGSDSGVAQPVTTIPNANLYLLAKNTGAASGFIDSNLAGLTVGSGLSFAQFTDMDADWQVFNTALSRQV